MNQIIRYSLLAAITFYLGLAIAQVGQKPAVLLERNAIRHGASLEAVRPAPLPVPTSEPQNIYDRRFRTESLTERVSELHEIKIEYPQLIEPASPREVAFNRFLKERMRKRFANSSNLRRVAIRKRENKTPVTETPLGIRYQVVYADVRVVSLKFIHRVTVAGRTDPVEHLETMNYDLARGRVIKLAELFQRRAGYLLVLGSFARGRIDGEYGHEVYAGGATAPKQSNFERWNFSPYGLMISFDESQFGETSIVPSEIIVPVRNPNGLY